MVKKNSFLLFFFVFLSTFSLIKLFDNSINLDTYEYGEWLINYQSGFIRRGIVGEAIYKLSYIFNNNIQISFFIILSFICLLYYRLNYILLKNIKFDFLNIFIIFSPLFYLFFVIINGVGIRKEILLYVFYLWYLTELSSKNFNEKKIWKFIYIFPLLLLIHEGLFFYLPYLFLPILFLVKKDKYKNFIFHSLVLVGLSVIMMIVLYFFKGSESSTLQICESLRNHAPTGCAERGPIFALQHDVLKDQANRSMLFFYFDADYKSWLGYIVYVFYSFVPLFLIFYYLNTKNKYFYLIIYFLTLGFSFPLFHVAEDWSRWFSIHFHLTAFLIFFLQHILVVHYEKKDLLKNLNSFLINKKVVCFFLFLIYSTFLHHEEYFSKDTKLELTYYKIFRNFK